VSGIAGLPAGQRRAIVARELEGRGYADIAQELHVSEGAVRGLIFRARDSLRSAAALALPPGLLQRLMGAEATMLTGAPETAVTAKLAAVAVVASVLAGSVTLATPSPDAIHGPATAQAAEIAPERPLRSAAAADPNQARTAPVRVGAEGDDAVRAGRDTSAGRQRGAGGAPASGDGEDGSDDDDDGRGDSRGAPGSGEHHSSDAENDDAATDGTESSGPGSGGSDTESSNSGPGSADDRPDDPSAETEDASESGSGSSSSGPGSGDDLTSGSDDDSGPPPDAVSEPVDD